MKELQLLRFEHDSQQILALTDVTVFDSCEQINLKFCSSMNCAQTGGGGGLGGGGDTGGAATGPSACRAGAPGTTNTGGGGGGPNNGTNIAGGAGGPGIVILRYKYQ